MRLEPLYRMAFDYPHGWSAAVGAGGAESQHLFLAEVDATDGSAVRSRGRPPSPAGGRNLLSDFHGVISTVDGATVLFECGGYGRAYPENARQIVCWLTHVSDDPAIAG